MWILQIFKARDSSKKCIHQIETHTCNSWAQTVHQEAQMMEFDGTPKVETESKDRISHHPRWKGLRMKELIRKTWDGSSLELHHKSRISQGLHPLVEFVNRILLCTSSVKQCSIINITSLSLFYFLGKI